VVKDIKVWLGRGFFTTFTQCEGILHFILGNLMHYLGHIVLICKHVSECSLLFQAEYFLVLWSFIVDNAYFLCQCGWRLGSFFSLQWYLIGVVQKLKIDTLNIINNSDHLLLLFIFMIPPCCYLRSLSLIEIRGTECEFKVLLQ